MNRIFVIGCLFFGFLFTEPGWSQHIGNSTEARLTQISSELRKRPDDTDLLIKEAELLGQLKRFDEQLSVCNKLIQIDAKSGAGYYYSTQAFSGLKNWPESLRAVEKYISLSKKSASIIGRRGMLLTRCKRYSEAVKDLTYAIEHDSDVVDYLTARAECYHELYGPCKLAVSDLQRASNLRPSDEKIKRLLVSISSKLAH